jgi:tRNA U38,U39,U40 pseudouridine synthase TruA
MRASVPQGMCESIRVGLIEFIDAAFRVSLKMIIKPPGVETAEDLTKAINERLPEDIRVWSWTRTLQGFNART